MQAARSDGSLAQASPRPRHYKGAAPTSARVSKVDRARVTWRFDKHPHGGGASRLAARTADAINTNARARRVYERTRTARAAHRPHSVSLASSRRRAMAKRHAQRQRGGGGHIERPSRGHTSSRTSGEGPVLVRTRLRAGMGGGGGNVDAATPGAGQVRGHALGNGIGAVALRVTAVGLRPTSATTRTVHVHEGSELDAEEQLAAREAGMARADPGMADAEHGGGDPMGRQAALDRYNDRREAPGQPQPVSEELPWDSNGTMRGEDDPRGAASASTVRRRPQSAPRGRSQPPPSNGDGWNAAGAGDDVDATFQPFVAAEPVHGQGQGVAHAHHRHRRHSRRGSRHATRHSRGSIASSGDMVDMSQAQVTQQERLLLMHQHSQPGHGSIPSRASAALSSAHLHQAVCATPAPYDGVVDGAPRSSHRRPASASARRPSVGVGHGGMAGPAAVVGMEPLPSAFGSGAAHNGRAASRRPQSAHASRRSSGHEGGDAGEPARWPMSVWSKREHAARFEAAVASPSRPDSRGQRTRSSSPQRGRSRSPSPARTQQQPTATPAASLGAGRVAYTGSGAAATDTGFAPGGVSTPAPARPVSAHAGIVAGAGAGAAIDAHDGAQLVSPLLSGRVRARTRPASAKTRAVSPPVPRSRKRATRGAGGAGTTRQVANGQASLAGSTQAGRRRAQSAQQQHRVQDARASHREVGAAGVEPMVWEERKEFDVGDLHFTKVPGWATPVRTSTTPARPTRALLNVGVAHRPLSPSPTRGSVTGRPRARPHTAGAARGGSYGADIERHGGVRMRPASAHAQQSPGGDYGGQRTLTAVAENFVGRDLAAAEEVNKQLSSPSSWHMPLRRPDVTIPTVGVASAVSLGDQLSASMSNSGVMRASVGTVGAATARSDGVATPAPGEWADDGDHGIYEDEESTDDDADTPGHTHDLRRRRPRSGGVARDGRGVTQGGVGGAKPVTRDVAGTGGYEAGHVRGYATSPAQAGLPAPHVTPRRRLGLVGDTDIVGGGLVPRVEVPAPVYPPQSADFEVLGRVIDLSPRAGERSPRSQRVRPPQPLPLPSARPSPPVPGSVVAAGTHTTAPGASAAPADQVLPSKQSKPEPVLPTSPPIDAPEATAVAATPATPAGGAEPVVQAPAPSPTPSPPAAVVLAPSASDTVVGADPLVEQARRRPVSAHAGTNSDGEGRGGRPQPALVRGGPVPPLASSPPAAPSVPDDQLMTIRSIRASPRAPRVSPRVSSPDGGKAEAETDDAQDGGDDVGDSPMRVVVQSSPRAARGTRDESDGKLEVKPGTGTEDGRPVAPVVGDAEEAGPSAELAAPATAKGGGDTSPDPVEHSDTTSWLLARQKARARQREDHRQAAARLNSQAAAARHTPARRRESGTVGFLPGKGPVRALVPSAGDLVVAAPLRPGEAAEAPGASVAGQHRRSGSGSSGRAVVGGGMFMPMAKREEKLQRHRRSFHVQRGQQHGASRHSRDLVPPGDGAVATMGAAVDDAAADERRVVGAQSRPGRRVRPASAVARSTTASSGRGTGVRSTRRHSSTAANDAAAGNGSRKQRRPASAGARRQPGGQSRITSQITSPHPNTLLVGGPPTQALATKSSFRLSPGVQGADAAAPVAPTPAAPQNEGSQGDAHIRAAVQEAEAAAAKAVHMAQEQALALQASARQLATTQDLIDEAATRAARQRARQQPRSTDAPSGRYATPVGMLVRPDHGPLPLPAQATPASVLAAYSRRRGGPSRAGGGVQRTVVRTGTGTRVVVSSRRGTGPPTITRARRKAASNTPHGGGRQTNGRRTVAGYSHGQAQQLWGSTASSSRAAARDGRSRTVHAAPAVGAVHGRGASATIDALRRKVTARQAHYDAYGVGGAPRLRQRADSGTFQLAATIPPPL